MQMDNLDFDDLPRPSQDGRVYVRVNLVLDT